MLRRKRRYGKIEKKKHIRLMLLMVMFGISKYAQAPQTIKVFNNSPLKENFFPIENPSFYKCRFNSKNSFLIISIKTSEMKIKYFDLSSDDPVNPVPRNPELKVGDVNFTEENYSFNYYFPCVLVFAQAVFYDICFPKENSIIHTYNKENIEDIFYENMGISKNIDKIISVAFAGNDPKKYFYIAYKESGDNEKIALAKVDKVSDTQPMTDINDIHFLTPPNKISKIHSVNSSVKKYNYLVVLGMYSTTTKMFVYEINEPYKAIEKSQLSYHPSGLEEVDYRAQETIEDDTKGFFICSKDNHGQFTIWNGLFTTHTKDILFKFTDTSVQDFDFPISNRGDLMMLRKEDSTVLKKFVGDKVEQKEIAKEIDITVNNKLKEMCYSDNYFIQIVDNSNTWDSIIYEKIKCNKEAKQLYCDNSNNNVQVCKKEFFLDGANSVTSKCETSSKGECQSGIGYEKSFSCLICDDSCKTCSGPKDTECVSCDDDKYRSIQGKCMGCGSRCDGCYHFGYLNCKECISGFKKHMYLGKVACCDLNQYFDSINYQCENCPEECESCTSQSICTSCKGGSKLNNSKLCQCESNHYFDKKKLSCQSCDKSCDQCKGASSKECVDCAPMYFKQDNNCLSKEVCFKEGGKIYVESKKICKKCEEGTYPSEKKDKCVNCEKFCLSCTGKGNTCTSCNTDTIIFEGTCYTKCPKYSFKGECVDSCDIEKEIYPDKETKTCGEKCIFGDDKIRVINHEGNECSKSCNDKYFKDKKSNRCKPCSKNCSSCINSFDNCTQCEPEFNLTDNEDNEAKKYCKRKCQIEKGEVWVKESNHCKRCGSNCKKCDEQTLKCIECSGSGFKYDEKDNQNCIK